MQVLQDRRVRWLLAVAALVHLLLATSFHLSPDETQYTLYSAHLAWSYFDHPPLVGWLQWPWGALGGSDLLMRVVPMTSWLLGAVGVMAVTATLYPETGAASGKTSAPLNPPLNAPFMALLLWTLSPIPHLLGVALVPDTLLMPITCATLYFCWQLCDARQLQRLPLWLGLGACLGLAGLSKYTAVLIGLGAVLALLLSHGPRLLTLRGTWLAVALAGLLISPVILWNATHDWISFAYQFGHAAGTADWRASRVLAFAVVQVLGYGALLLVGVVVAWRLRTGGDRNTSPDRKLSPVAFSLCFGLPALLLLTYLSGRGSTLPHWSTSAWIALVPAAAAGCQALWMRSRKLLMALGVFQVLACVGLAGLMLAGGVSSEVGEQARSPPGQVSADSKFNPFADLYGWDIAARNGRALAEKHKNSQGIQPTLAVFNWTLASRIAWYARPLGVKVVQRHFDQFGLWWGVLQPGESVMLLDWSQMSFSPPVGPTQFERCELVDQLPVNRMGRQIAHFNTLLCHNWQGPLDPSLGRSN